MCGKMVRGLGGGLGKFVTGFGLYGAGFGHLHQFLP